MFVTIIKDEISEEIYGAFVGEVYEDVQERIREVKNSPTFHNKYGDDWAVEDVVNEMFLEDCTYIDWIEEAYIQEANYEYY